VPDFVCVLSDEDSSNNINKAHSKKVTKKITSDDESDQEEAQSGRKKRNLVQESYIGCIEEEDENEYENKENNRPASASSSSILSKTHSTLSKMNSTNYNKSNLITIKEDVIQVIKPNLNNYNPGTSRTNLGSSSSNSANMSLKPMQSLKINTIVDDSDDSDSDFNNWANNAAILNPTTSKKTPSFSSNSEGQSNSANNASKITLSSKLANKLSDNINVEDRSSPIIISSSRIEPKVLRSTENASLNVTNDSSILNTTDVNNFHIWHIFSPKILKT
jgi:hypothetical protein